MTTLYPEQRRALAQVEGIPQLVRDLRIELPGFKGFSE
jgi:hypothetical protein